MCRSIRPLHNYDPPTTASEVEEAALQYVRKISGMRKPARANQEAFDHAVAAVTEASLHLLDLLLRQKLLCRFICQLERVQALRLSRKAPRTKPQTRKALILFFAQIELQASPTFSFESDVASFRIE